MRKFLIGMALLAAAETAALACSCIAPGTPGESRPLAREALKDAVAIVEGEALSEYRPGRAGERVRVRRVLWGKAPKEFAVERGAFDSSASCALLLERGKRKILILHPARSAARAGGRFRIQSLCSDFLVSERGFLAMTLQEARRSRR
jgi:hypothetical protein